VRVTPLISTSALRCLDCARCERTESADRLRSVCGGCGGPLLARYDLARTDLRGLPWDLPHRSSDLWRYAELLPVQAGHFRVGLGEGMTPLLRLTRFGPELGLDQLWVKDEGRNPTGSFKARGMAVAIARAAELGCVAVCAPSAGNAGLALSAYAARHGLRALTAFPADISPAFVRDARLYGAEVLVSGATIREAGKALRQFVAEHAEWRDAFDVSTLREPCRLEGKKTMGYEIAEQLDGTAPDAVVYPTGGGTGLIGIEKAFDEMAELGWVDATRRPRMIAVQVEGCAPIVAGLAAGLDSGIASEDARTRCWGLRVPAPFADREMIATIRRTGGTAVSVSEQDLMPTHKKLRRLEGIDASPEGSAALAALPLLLRSGGLRTGERVVVLNTASSEMYK
jgi:threonine synthase